MLARQQFGIEMIEARLHFGLFDRGKIVAAQIRRRLDPTVAAGQPQIVLIGEEHGPRSVILGDDHRLAHGGILIGPENSCKPPLRSRSTSLQHFFFRNRRIFRNSRKIVGG